MDAGADLGRFGRLRRVHRLRRPLPRTHPRLLQLSVWDGVEEDAGVEGDGGFEDGTGCG
jgi:hypothetical protein